MLHYRQQELFNKHYESIGSSSFTHNYKGKEYNISSDAINDLSPEVLQSVSTRLAKEHTAKKPMPKPRPTPSPTGSKPKSRGRGLDDTKSNGENNRALIRKELLRLSLVEFPIEDKLHYPRVFKKLLSEPHLALYEKKITIETKHELYLFVDQAVGYNHEDKGFHNMLIEEAKKIKGIKVFYGPRLQVGSKGIFDGTPYRYYWHHIPKLVPKGKTILAISQGCGGTEGAPPKGYNFHFATHFCKGDDCGCNGIHDHEGLKHVKVHYELDTPKKLKSLVL
jgi:hypothetical protein